MIICLALAVIAVTAAAQSYPTKPIRFIVPFPPGGATDVGARFIAEYLTRAFGQQVYVENKSANGTIGVEIAAPRCRSSLILRPRWIRSGAISSPS